MEDARLTTCCQVRPPSAERKTPVRKPPAIATSEPVPVEGMTGFVSQVEYADGKVWVPNRASLENAQLLRVIAPSPEEQRLTDLYRTKGLSTLIEELRKF